MMCRRDAQGVIHLAHPPTHAMFYLDKNAGTGAQCNFNINTNGDLQSVPQDGPTCLWCLMGIKR
jgi:hypothetical protein